MMNSGKTRLLLTLLLLATIAAGARAQDAEPAQPYEGVSYPKFKNGRLETLLEAKKAEVYDLTDGTPRILLEDVSIIIYDHSEQSIKNTPDDQPLPVKMTITSDRGFFTSRPPEPGAQPEEVANLEGDVVMRQMRVNPNPLKPPKRKTNLPPEIETEIHCEHAQWNNTLRKLNGDGDVEFIQEDSRIYGTGFLYVADDEAMETGGGASNVKDWGGIVFIEHNARMLIDRGGVRTEITCKDTASYKLTEREIQFERDVVVLRPGLKIESDILKVLLRHEDDPMMSLPENERDGLLPGQVKSIVATIGKRPGSVIITGFKPDAAGVEQQQFSAKGGRADFDCDTSRITLIDPRDLRLPEVEFGSDRITDDNLIFSYSEQNAGAQSNALENTEFFLDTLNAFGGHGRVVLRTRQMGEDSGPTVPTTIVYKGDMSYIRSEGRIRFNDSVNLTRSDPGKEGYLNIKAESLDVRLTSDGQGAEPTQLNRVIAEQDVTIIAGDREAKAHRAEYEVASGAEVNNMVLDILNLYGPPQRTPPHPSIRDTEGNHISAPEIRMHRLKTPAGQKDRHLVWAGQGIASCDFVAKATAGEEPRIINITCENGMEYNELHGRAQFEGKVLATSDAPEDNYVLNSDRLIVNFKESPNPEKPGDDLVWIRRITAEGNAILEQDTRVCEAIKIIRDFPSMDENVGEIYLQGAPAEGARPPKMAVYREESGGRIGSMFTAVLIKSTATGNRIEANGPGHLSMPDNDLPGQRSEIHFQRYASYESFPATNASQAIFRQSVILRQPSRGLTINCEEMNAAFLRDDVDSGGRADDQVDIEAIGRLRRAEFKIGVKVESIETTGRRVAVGDRGLIDFEPTGNIVKMSADGKPGTRERVLVQDSGGLTLHSPAVEMRQGQGYMRADGPGELHIPGDRGATGTQSRPTAVWYGERGSLVYNELALNIKVSDRVRIIQPGVNNNWRSPSLDGVCDRLDITLLEPPSADMSGQSALSRVQKMDAVGNTIIRVYADPPPDNPNIDWPNRPGTTFFCRGDRGEFFVRENRVEMSSQPGRQPQLLLNVVDSGRAPLRQRMKADRFIMDTYNGRWSFHGQQESNTLREGEPFEFRD